MIVTNSNKIAELSSRLGKLYTGAVSDILDEMEYRKQCLPANIRPLDSAMNTAGPVFTVRGRARHFNDGSDPRYKQIEVLNNIFPHSVVVIYPGDENSCAHWGELMSNVARQKGARGAIIAGGLRDSRQILDIGFPVFYIFHNPTTAVWRWELTDYNIPLQIGGVAIRPGDYVLGDIDGIIVIPGEIIEDVITRAEEVTSKETVVRLGLQKGEKIEDLFERYKVF